jgi:hypothetical protein
MDENGRNLWVAPYEETAGASKCRAPPVTAMFVQEAAVNQISHNELHGAEFSESRESFTN